MNTVRSSHLPMQSFIHLPVNNNVMFKKYALQLHLLFHQTHTHLYIPDIKRNSSSRSMS